MINYFTHFPFFILAALLIILPLLYVVQIHNPERKQLNLLVIVFTSLTILNSIFNVFDVKNISDCLFILLFFTFYYYYKSQIIYLQTKNIYLFIGLSAVLLSFTFFNINNPAFPTKTKTAGTEIKKPSVNVAAFVPNIKHTVNVTVEKIISQIIPRFSIYQMQPKNPIPDWKNSESRGSIKWKSNPQDRMEEKREYHGGLFRIPHIASYFFGFLFLFFAFQYQKTKRITNIILLLICLLLCVYIGSRAILVTFILSSLLFLMRRKFIIYFLGLIIGLGILIVSNDYFIEITKNSFLNQYFVLIQTVTENFSRLSRFRLWYSWWLAMHEFGFWDIIIGKSYANSLLANDKNLGYYIWFHNDFLSILYSYGLIALVLYVGFFIKIYHDNRVLIRNNFFIFIFFTTMLISAVLNGFYYYFPVFLLYPFFIMIRKEKQQTQ